jgi:hypothetical protein
MLLKAADFAHELAIDCMKGCRPELVAVELIRRGHFKCRDVRRPQ